MPATCLAHLFLLDSFLTLKVQKSMDTSCRILVWKYPARNHKT